MAMIKNVGSMTGKSTGKSGMIKNGVRTLMVDPPEGWLYGFPAELPDGMTLEELFIKHNYPEELRELAIKHSRYWYT